MTSQDGIYLSLKLQAPIVVGVDLGAVVERLRQSVRVIGRRTVQSARRNAPGKRLRHQIDYTQFQVELRYLNLLRMRCRNRKATR